MNLPGLFADLTATWKQDAAWSSSVDDIVGHPAYQRIIGLGRSVVPLILADLAREPGQWFPAPLVLTGAAPVAAADAGDVRAMTDAWLTWGRQAGDAAPSGVPNVK